MRTKNASLNRKPSNTQSGFSTPSKQSDRATPYRPVPFHRYLGNQAMLRLASGGIIQPKLTLGPVDDLYEREADQVAKQVALQLGTPGQPSNSPQVEDSQPKPVIHRMSKPAALIPKAAESGAEAVNRQVYGQPNYQDVLTKMENTFNTDFSGVRIHTNTQKARDIQALAYTQGNDIYFAPGNFQPNTQSGQELLGHELTHVIQQRQGKVKPTVQMADLPINLDTRLENEADEMGVRAKESTAQEIDQRTPPIIIGKAPSTQPISGPDVIQARFGFELELTVAMEALKPSEGRYDNASIYGDPKEINGAIKHGQGEGFSVHVDHQEKKDIIGNGVVDDEMYQGEGAPIIELVTDPIDEYGPEEDLDRQIEALNNFRANLEPALGRRVQLSSFNNVTARDNIVVGGMKRGRQNLDAYTHSTYGVQLEKIPRAFLEHAERVTNQRGVAEKQLADNLRKAYYAGNRIGNWVFENYRVEFGIDASDLDKMKGLFTLLSNYMITFTPSADSLWKNRTGIFFYKSKLSDVRDGLPTKIKDLLKKKRKAIVPLLVEAARNQRREELDPSIDWARWANGVLKGSGDWFLNHTKNPYSPALGPEPVGPEENRREGVVVEDREVAKIIRRFGRKVPAGEWAKMMKTVRTMLRGIND